MSEPSSRPAAFGARLGAAPATFVPAVREVLDRRAERKGVLPAGELDKSSESVLSSVIERTSLLAERVPLLTVILALAGTFVRLARPASGAGPGLLAVAAGLLLGTILGLLLGPAAPPEPPIHDPGPLPSWLR